MGNKKMKERRVALRLSQDRLANMCGVTRQIINKMERTTHNPSLRVCQAVSTSLHMSLDELFADQPTE